jgi:hypothetical protein
MSQNRCKHSMCTDACKIKGSICSQETILPAFHSARLPPPALQAGKPNPSQRNPTGCTAKAIILAACLQRQTMTSPPRLRRQGNHTGSLSAATGRSTDACGDRSGLATSASKDVLRGSVLLTLLVRPLRLLRPWPRKLERSLTLSSSVLRKRLGGQPRGGSEERGRRGSNTQGRAVMSAA